MVCLFLQGGNDYANTVIPYDTATYNSYQSARPSLAISYASLAGTVVTPNTPAAGGRQFALNPSMSSLMPKWNNGNLAIVFNVGSLIVPTSQAQYNAKSVALPPNLFSHNDQQSFWQSLGPEGSTMGWGGKFADFFLSNNSPATFSCITATNNTVFLQGNTAIQYSIPSTGPVQVTGVDVGVFGAGGAAGALQQLLSNPRTQFFEKNFSTISKRSLDSYTTVTNALNAVTLNTVFPSNEIGAQVREIARTIGARVALGAKRQVFFAQIGGWDDHQALGADGGPQAIRIGNIAACIAAFNDAMVELGMNNDVVLFTASDFGRTLQQNASGTDHGWGGTHLVCGGGVVGKQFYGTPPTYTLGGSDDAGQGRLIPSEAIEQYAATIGKWMGMLPAELVSALPNLANFPTKDLGFLG
jgi:uncharacterized protein (DUF1501 family)